MPCSGRRGNRASEVEVGLLGLPRQNIEPSSLQEKLHVDLTGQGSRGKRHRGKAESPETGSVYFPEEPGCFSEDAGVEAGAVTFDLKEGGHQRAEEEAHLK